MVLALSVVSSLSLVLKVIDSTDKSHYNISFLVYGFTFLLFGPEAAVVVVLVSNLVEWAWHQYVWYIQSFNIATYVIGMQVAYSAYRWINPGKSYFEVQGVAGVLGAMAIFTLFNHLLIGIVIWLARGENFEKSGVFGFFPVMLDFTLLCMGAGACLLWLLSPVAVILVLLPLYLIYSTLKVPALERQSETDPKTGLYNARYFERALQTELSRANRFDRPLSVVMADLDLLRNINNTYGHLAGDEVLVGVSKILQNSLREYDVISRFGGEEYAILMPETTYREAFPRIEAIRQRIENSEFSVPSSVTPIKATMSFGIAARVGFNQDASDILHNADAALYHAKLKGRNCAYIYTEDAFTNLSVLESECTNKEEIQAKEAGLEEILAGELNKPAAQTYHKPGEAIQTDHQVVRVSVSARSKWTVNLYIGSLAVIAIILFISQLKYQSSIDWIGLSMFILLVVLTEWLAIDIYIRNTAVSTSAAPILGGILIFGPIGALLLSLSFATVAFIKHRSQFSRFFFNASNQLIAGMFYTGLFALVGVSLSEFRPGIQFLLCLVAAAIVYFCTTILIALGMSYDLGTPLKDIWLEHFSWLAPYYGGIGMLAYALMFSYQIAGWMGTAVILVPLLLLRLSQKQYIDKTRAVVNQLRDKNMALEKSAEEIGKLNEGLLDTLAEVVDLRDPHVLGHSRQVARYAALMARNLGLHPKQVELVRKAGLLHDIGKLGISETILFKPGPLTPQEYVVVKEHVVMGADLLKTSNHLDQLIPIIRHHHERYDGKGYPDGQKGKEIPLEARILGVADAVEAMASDRPYRRGLTYQEIVEELTRNAGSQFDPQVVEAFVQITHLEGNKIIINSARRSGRVESHV
ncbi:MAG TPA: diguanylate cyclase [Anaerolineales bacterium]|nr:diguanylate cyclase [Anaerolineales bacterium]